MKVLLLLAFVFTIAFAQTACGPCQMGVNVVKDYLTKTDAELMEMLFKLCTKIPENYRDQCTTGVRGFGPALIRTLRINFAGEPRQICEKVGLCTPANAIEAQHQEKATFILESVKSMIKGEAKECNIDQLREFYYWLPPSVQREIKSQLIGNILGQFPRLRQEVVEKLIQDMFDPRVPQQRVCDDLDRILIPEARRRQECNQRCLDKVDLSPERLIRVVMKCQLEFNCYFREVAEEMQNVARCAHECYMNEPFPVIAK